VLGGAALVVIPILLVKILISLILLPFKLLGLVAKAVFGVIGAIGGLLLALLALVLLPLLPLLILGGLVWLIVRPSQGPPAPRLTA
jgi:hypothetical protein